MHVSPNLVSAAQPAAVKVSTSPVAGQSFSTILHQVSNTKTESGVGAHQASNNSSKHDDENKKSVAHDKDTNGDAEVNVAPVTPNDPTVPVPVPVSLQFGNTQNVATEASANSAAAVAETSVAGGQVALWPNATAPVENKGTAHLELGASDAFAAKQGTAVSLTATPKGEVKSSGDTVEAPSVTSQDSARPMQPLVQASAEDSTDKTDAKVDGKTDAKADAPSIQVAGAVPQQIASIMQNVMPVTPLPQAQQPMPAVGPIAATNKVSAPKANGVTLSNKIDVSRQTPGSTKDRAAVGDMRSKRSEDETDSEQGSEPSRGSESSFAAKVSEAMNSAVAHPAAQGATHVDANASAQASAFHVQGAKDLQPEANVVSTPAPQVAAPTPGGAVDNKPANGISSAQLLQTVGQSEMKLGMHSAEFGNISISTSVNHQSLSAQISTEHTELGRALAAHLPAIEEKLGSAYGVQAKVELRNSSTMQQHDGTADQQAGQSRPGYNRNFAGGTAPSMNSSSAAVVSNTWSSADSSRLDIRI